MVYTLWKTNVKVAIKSGRILYYSPELDLCFVKDCGEWQQIDCSKSWTKITKTDHLIEWN